MDRYEIKWEIDHDQTVTFRETLLPKSFNTYTVTGLKAFGIATYSISVTAYNEVGNVTSPSLSVAANFSAGITSTEDNVTSCGVAVIAAVATVALIIAIALGLIIAALLAYIHNLKSKKCITETESYNNNISEIVYT